MRARLVILCLGAVGSVGALSSGARSAVLRAPPAPVPLARPAVARSHPVAMAEDDGEPADWGDSTSSTSKPDLFVPILVGTSFGGYALIVLYDIFFGNGLCGLTVQCSSSPWG